MKTWTLWLSGAFTTGIVLLAIAAGWRATPVTAVPDTRGWRDGHVTRDFESHYDAVFPVRTLGINLWGAIAYVLFREGRPGVVVGRDGWLYSAEEFQTSPGAEAQLYAHLLQFGEVRSRLARRGTALLVALVPAKTRVYPGTLGAGQPAPIHADLYGHALGALRAQSIVAPDLHRALAACKAGAPHDAPEQAMFLRTDTHWTPAGARCAAERLATAAHAAGWRAPRVEYRTSLERETLHRGDLMNFLPLDPWFAWLLPPGDVLEVQRTEPVEPANDPGSSPGQDLLSAAPQPKVVLVGTSYSANPLWNFTGALQQSFGEDVVNYAAPARGPFRPMFEYLDSADFRAAPPRLVIWEVPERYLPMPEEKST